MVGPLAWPNQVTLALRVQGSRALLPRRETSSCPLKPVARRAGKALVLSLEIVPQLPLSDMRSRDAKVHEGQLRIDVNGS